MAPVYGQFVQSRASAYDMWALRQIPTPKKAPAVRFAAGNDHAKVIQLSSLVVPQPCIWQNMAILKLRTCCRMLQEHCDTAHDE